MNWREEKKIIITKLLSSLKDGDRVLYVHDPRLYAGAEWGGTTKIWYHPEDDIFYVYSFGRRWSDIAPTTWDAETVQKYLFRIPIRYLRDAEIRCMQHGITVPC